MLGQKGERSAEGGHKWNTILIAFASGEINFWAQIKEVRKKWVLSEKH